MIKLAAVYIPIPSRINSSTVTFRIFIDATQIKRDEIKKKGMITMDLKRFVFSGGLEGLAVHG
jgi:hypothetical protein